MVAFPDESTGTVTSWEVGTFGDGAESTEQSPIHEYKTGGQRRMVVLYVEGGGKSRFSRVWDGDACGRR